MPYLVSFFDRDRGVSLTICHVINRRDKSIYKSIQKTNLIALSFRQEIQRKNLLLFILGPIDPICITNFYTQKGEILFIKYVKIKSIKYNN